MKATRVQFDQVPAMRARLPMLLFRQGHKVLGFLIIWTKTFMLLCFTDCAGPLVTLWTNCDVSLNELRFDPLRTIRFAAVNSIWRVQLLLLIFEAANKIFR